MTTRTGADRCPGLLRPFDSADGSIIRVRVPGGDVPTSALVTLAEVAATHGTPGLHVTTRGSLQVRGLPTPLPDEVARAVLATSLFPSRTHERARNIIADPLADPSLDLPAIVAELDAAICAEPVLASLPGRFLFAIAGGEGGVLAEPYDLAYEATSPEAGIIRVGERGLAVSRSRAVAALVERAVAFLSERADERTWNVRDLPGDAAVYAGTTDAPFAPAALLPPPAPGPVGEDLVVAVPLGVITPEAITALAAVTDRVRTTAWRTLIVPGGAVHGPALAAAGVVTDPNSPWTRLSACSGAPYCARTTSPTSAIAREIAEDLPPSAGRVHLVGCDRACGAPHTDHLLITDPADADAVLAILENHR
ncbi:cobalamin biosynthesis protein CobG [Janibacter sp. GXQ6167]|uniref:cobalamin biosynthesis protein CobG n=1 Tax=Janibacter sp. GXQ6167 TaxID=3240791 RepID=UPI003524BEE9